VPSKKQRCRHCRSRYQSRPGRLCRTCYDQPDVREHYLAGCVRACVSPTPTSSLSPRPAHPTAALPGTPEKMAVMAQRALQGASLFHPDDAAWGELGNARAPLSPYPARGANANKGRRRGEAA